MQNRRIVAKFGGTSLANATQFVKVRDIILADSARKYVVVSAPGKRFSGDIKVTDMLIALSQSGSEAEFDRQLADIRARYEEIAAELSLKTPLCQVFDTIRSDVKRGAGYDYIVSRGEYINGLLMAEYLGYEFADAAELIYFGNNGKLDCDKTYAAVAAKVADGKNYVFPGFYGVLPNGRIKAFSRGGSDITGSIIARGASVDLYENWTDVPGVLMVDPRMIPEAKVIRQLTYRELRELSYMGANVLHDEAVFPVKEPGIPINVRNTNDITAPGTMIMPAAEEDSPYTITGIAGKKGFCAYFVEKNLMNNDVGYVRRVLSYFEDNGISIEHIPTGIDNMSVVVEDAKLNGLSHADVSRGLTQAVDVDSIEVVDHIALIAIVGRNMAKRYGTAATIMTELGRAGVNIIMLDQGVNEMSIIVGVAEEHYEKAIRVIYDVFVG
ncbi:MAG: aspartate kinase [Clostridia bacterium]|nr:aspartate kinase [Clostridia bacterium]